MFHRKCRLFSAVIVLAVFTTIAAFPFHLLCEHSQEAERGVCGVCIALSLGLSPTDDGLTTVGDDVVNARIPGPHAPRIRNAVAPLQVPRGPPSSLA
jgi:hypothetical protein